MHQKCIGLFWCRMHFWCISDAFLMHFWCINQKCIKSASKVHQMCIINASNMHQLWNKYAPALHQFSYVLRAVLHETLSNKLGWSSKLLRICGLPMSCKAFTMFPLIYPWDPCPGVMAFPLLHDLPWQFIEQAVCSLPEASNRSKFTPFPNLPGRKNVLQKNNPQAAKFRLSLIFQFQNRIRNALKMHQKCTRCFLTQDINIRTILHVFQ